MKRILALLTLGLLVFAPFSARAQEATSTPNPNPQNFDDLGMHYTAPPFFRSIFQKNGLKVDDISDPAVVAAWFTFKDNHRLSLLLSQQAFSGALPAFEQQFSGQLRDQGGEGAIIRNRQDFRLKNGMPARYMEMTAGEGFNIQKVYVVIWVDGYRGCALLFSTPLSGSDEKTAKLIFSQLTAVRYPINREQP